MQQVIQLDVHTVFCPDAERLFFGCLKSIVKTTLDLSQNVKKRLSCAGSCSAVVTRALFVVFKPLVENSRVKGETLELDLSERRQSTVETCEDVLV